MFRGWRGPRSSTGRAIACWSFPPRGASLTRFAPPRRGSGNGGAMQRFGMVIGLKPEAEQQYREHHAAVWPEVLETIRQCNIRNYSIYLKDGMLYSYFEYHGADFAADMVK